MQNKKTVFDELFHLDVNERAEKKKVGGSNLTYLSWAWAWAEVKKRYAEASYEILKFENNLPYVHDEKTGYMVFTKVTIENITHEMWLPVMDGANNAMKSEPYDYQVIKWTNGKRDGFTNKSVGTATMFDINKTIMRCLVKNLAMFGLGLYIYSGEDLPEIEPPKPSTKSQRKMLQDLIEDVSTHAGKSYEEMEKIAMNKAGTTGRYDNITNEDYGKMLNYVKELNDYYEKNPSKSKKQEKSEVLDPKEAIKMTANKLKKEEQESMKLEYPQAKK